jgi:hypothetical protein
MDIEELKRIVEQFAKEEYPSGELEMYADYQDELSPEQAFDIIESNHPWEKFNDLLWDAYLDAESEYIHDLEGEFDSWCENNGYACSSEDLSNEGIYLDEYISIVPPADHFLDQEVNCRLIVDNGDANYDFTHNPNQDNNFQIEEGAGIIWLGGQLGYSVEQMQAALNQLGADEDSPIIDDFQNSDKFLDSLVHEAANAWGFPALTFLCKLSLRDLIKFKENHSAVTVDLNGMNCGFFDEWQGGGSLLELDCGKSSITIPYDKIFRLIPDIHKYGYSVDEVYGLWGGAYADAEVE